MPAVLLALAVVTVGVYAGVRHGEFVRLDDNRYVTENPNVRAGLTAAGARWALTATDAANWHPLTWLSHMLDVELFGLDPGAHHLVSLAWHTANALLLLLLLDALTGAPWRSAVAAALFAIHPLHVESVAWVAERKDVLSTFFWLAASLAYLRHAKTGRRAPSVTTVALFALGLTAKPMLVTLPFALLLLDFWPLDRLHVRPQAAPGQPRTGRLLPLVREKAPLFALAAASGVVTLMAQRAGSMVRDLAEYSLGVRVENAVVSYARYLIKALWPAGLAIPYGHPGDSLTLPQVGGAALLLAGITALALGARRSRPYAAAGWLWFLGTLVPVIGLVQVSDQAMADRYTYVPLVGLSVALVWAAADGLAAASRDRIAAAAACGLLLASLAAMTASQVGHWRDNVTLFRNTARVTGRENLALVSMERRRQQMLQSGLPPAVVELRMGDEMLRHRKFDEAAAHYRRALAADPRQGAARARLGVLCMDLGRYEEAAAQFAELVRANPRDAAARADLGRAYKALGRSGEARRSLEEALRLDPSNRKAAEALRGLP